MEENEAYLVMHALDCTRQRDSCRRLSRWQSRMYNAGKERLGSVEECELGSPGAHGDKDDPADESKSAEHGRYGYRLLLIGGSLDRAEVDDLLLSGEGEPPHRETDNAEHDQQDADNGAGFHGSAPGSEVRQRENCFLRSSKGGQHAVIMVTMVRRPPRLQAAHPGETRLDGVTGVV
jgi:hypothetical protein